MPLQSKVSENPKPLEHLCWQTGCCFLCSFQSHRGLIIIFYSPCGPFFTFQPCRHQLLSWIHQSVTDEEAGESRSKMEFEGAIYKRTPYFCPILLIIPGFYMTYLKFAEVCRATKWWKVNRLETGHICFQSVDFPFTSWYQDTFSPVSVFKHTACSIFHTLLTGLSSTTNLFSLDEFLLMDKMIECIPRSFPQAHTQYGTRFRGWGGGCLLSPRNDQPCLPEQ